MSVTTGQFSAADFVPDELAKLENVQTAIPAIAKDARLIGLVEEAVKRVPTSHDLCLGDARAMKLEPESVHLVLTSPPYWTLKQYGDVEGQLGHVVDYETFLGELDKVWKRCFRALAPGGRLICVVGDVCLSRRKNNGRHTVIPLHASIQEHCRQIGFDNLAPIIWHKIANAVHEVENGSPFLGKPYEPNAVIKNDIEFILMERKPGGYRQPSVATRILSVISDENHKTWFQQIWMGVTGASTKNHPAPYPLELAETPDPHVQLCWRYRARSLSGDRHDHVGGHAEWAKLDRLRDRQELSGPRPQTDQNSLRAVLNQQGERS